MRLCDDLLLGSLSTGCCCFCHCCIAKKLLLLRCCFLLSCDRLSLTFAGTGISACTLAANRKALAMTQAAIASDIHQSLDGKLLLAAGNTLYLELVGDDLAYRRHFIFGQVVDLLIFGDPRFF